MFAQSTARIVKSAGIRSIHTTPKRLDLSKVTLIGRLGADPVVRTSEKTGTAYCVYPVATSVGPLGPADADGNKTPPPTSWHSVWSFQENANNKLARLGKGSTVYVEAELTMKEQPAGEDGQKKPAQPFLLHRTIQVINKVARSDAEGSE